MANLKQPESTPAGVSSNWPSDDIALVDLRSLVTDAANAVSYEKHSDPITAVPTPPAFTFGPIEKSFGPSYYNQRLCREVGLYRIYRGCLFGDGLVARQGALTRCVELGLYEESISRLLLPLGNRGLRVRQEPGPFVAIAGLAHQTYGHWLIDHLPKLWVLEQCGIDIDHVRFLLPSTLQTFAREWLRLLGIRDEQLVFYDWRSEAVEAEELILPTVMRFESVASPLLQQAAVMLLERTIAGGGLSPANTDDLPERLYIPRAPGAYRALINREEIEERAVAAGFAIVRPAQLPIVEQIALFRNARQVIGEYGSALHNTLFSRPGTVVAALRGSQPEPWYLQSGIGRALDQPTGYVFGRTNTDDPSMSYTVDPDDFADCLRLVLSQ